MTPVRTRWARRILAVCAASAFLGCDDAGSRQATAVQAETSALRVADGPKDQVISTLQGVASSDSTSAAVILAQHSLGQVQYAKARDLIVEVSSLQQQATRLTFEIAQRARAAQGSLLLEQQIRELDPTKNVESIRALGTSARGDGNAATFDVAADAKLPTLAAAQQKKSELEGDVAKTQNALDTSTSDRDRLLAEAGRLAAVLETQSGPERVDTVKALAEVRQQAALASRQVSELTSQVAMLQAGAAEQEAIVKELQAAIEALGSQADLLGNTWKDLQAVADQQRSQARDLLLGEQASVKVGVDALKKVLDELNAKRDEAQEALDASITSYSKAASTSGQLSSKLGAVSGEPSFEKPAWDAQLEATSTDRITLDKAAAQQALADLQSDRARSLAAMISTAELVEALSESVNTPVPEFLNSAKLRDELTKAVQGASEQFAEVDQTLEGASLSSEKLSMYRPVKATSKIMALANHAALADLAASYGVAKSVADSASKLRDDLKAYVDEVRSNNIPLPSLPVSIVGVAPPPKPEAPAEGEAAPKPEGDAATANTATSTDAAAADPEVQAVRGLFKQGMSLAAQGNTDELRNLSVIEEGGEEALTLTISFMQNFEKFKQAVTAKFPDDPAAKMAVSALEKLTSGDAMSVKVDGEKAYAGRVMEGEVENARKVDGTWKLVFAGAKTDAGKAAMAQMTTATTTFGQIAADVESGTITSFAEVLPKLAALQPGTPPTPPAEGATPAPEGTTPAPEGTTPAPEGTPPPAETPPAQP